MRERLAAVRGERPAEPAPVPAPAPTPLGDTFDAPALALVRTRAGWQLVRLTIALPLEPREGAPAVGEIVALGEPSSRTGAFLEFKAAAARAFLHGDGARAEGAR